MLYAKPLRSRADNLEGIVPVMSASSVRSRANSLGGFVAFVHSVVSQVRV